MAVVTSLTYEGVIPNLERRHKETDSEFMRKDIERFMRERHCHACNGARLKPVVLAITVHGLNIMDICGLGVDSALDLFKNTLKLSESEQFIARQIMKEITDRLGFMSNVGLNYLGACRERLTRFLVVKRSVFVWLPKLVPGFRGCCMCWTNHLLGCTSAITIV